MIVISMKHQLDCILPKLTKLFTLRRRKEKVNTYTHTHTLSVYISKCQIVVSNRNYSVYTKFCTAPFRRYQCCCFCCCCQPTSTQSFVDSFWFLFLFFLLFHFIVLLLYLIWAIKCWLALNNKAIFHQCQSLEIMMLQKNRRVIFIFFVSLLKNDIQKRFFSAYYSWDYCTHIVPKSHSDHTTSFRL